jgi:glyoxylase-like metal-dependent hydrolase (beta-lactamase superfamily II)
MSEYPSADATRVAQKAPGWSPARRKPELLKVTDRVYSATGYAISNVLYVITDRSLVVIDTTESRKAARASLHDFRKVSALPVSYIIYTHYHGDHTRGAEIFYRPATKVIAQRKLLEERAKLTKLLPHRTRVDALQFGASLDANERAISLTCHGKKAIPLTTFRRRLRNLITRVTANCPRLVIHGAARLQEATRARVKTLGS